MFLSDVIHTARGGVDRLDEMRRGKAMSQMEISSVAGMPDTGSLYCRMYKRGDVSLSKYIRFLRAVGYELMIVEKEGGNEKQSQRSQ